ncbi:mannose-6-phosphate isomerase [Synechococcus sp. RSCCF101]|uniref:phosphomannose isomerase type II C-terminal cupin domain n=1 Tax=Synechococcus sp. RSCCF101 TaxID=2511069 RepID=UPI001244C7D0|nr:phosphomannose isomerase type II C-terminal cupin domain [Synechococcus sp. RSCCF101]QEY31159.1 mannose-6-phosphate isomerase [Synechococcus sp. RSCCF101]
MQRVVRPWGWYETLLDVAGTRVKRLHVDPLQRLSLQRHRHRCEHWVVTAGQGWIHRPSGREPLAPGQSCTIPQGAWHRAEAGAEGLEIVEVQRGTLLIEEDVERSEDDYGRVTEPGGPGPNPG